MAMALTENEHGVAAGRAAGALRLGRAARRRRGRL